MSTLLVEPSRTQNEVSRERRGTASAVEAITTDGFEVAHRTEELPFSANNRSGSSSNVRVHPRFSELPPFVETAEPNQISPSWLPQQDIESQSSLVSDLLASVPSLGALDMASTFGEGAFRPFQSGQVIANPVFPVMPRLSEVASGPFAFPQPGFSAVPPIYREAVYEASHQDYDVDVCKFIDNWALCNKIRDASNPGREPSARIQGSHALKWPRSPHIRAEDVDRDECDMQGIDWTRIGTTRAQARKARKIFCEAVQGEGDSAPGGKSRDIEGSALCYDLVRFRRMNMDHRTWIQHFQLRNLVAVASHNDIFYASRSQVHRTDAIGDVKSTVMDLTDTTPFSAAGFTITSIAAANDVLVAGSYSGEYALSALDCSAGTFPITGLVTNDRYGITCHVELFARRGIGRPASAAFSSNDQHIRVLDCATNTFTHDSTYSYPINCSVTDPHAQMRLVVGDNRTALLTSADSGQVLMEITHHSANIFAANWCQDGVHVATGAEDGRVLVYDVRKWSEPVADIVCENAYPRSLRFSPSGASPSMLLIAEAEDAVVVVEAGGGMFQRRQVVDFFGTVAGVGWRPDGRGFWVANGDATFGGLMEFELTNDAFSRSFLSEKDHTRPGFVSQVHDQKRRYFQMDTLDEAFMKHDISDDAMDVENDGSAQSSAHDDYDPTEYNGRTKRIYTTPGRRNLNLGHMIL